jgi:hydrogenase/urease accessory protein HupE
VRGRWRAVAPLPPALSLALLLVVLLAAPLDADIFRPAYLQLTEVDATIYDVLWKVPAMDETTTLKVAPELPSGTRTVGEERSLFVENRVERRWRIQVPGGLAGKAIVFTHLSETRIDVLVRLVRRDGTVQLQRILPVDPRFVVKASPGSLEVVRTYTVLGVEHIWNGVDHLLFVAALVLLVQGTRRLVATITAFTLAHSLTLAGATLGLVHVPGPPVEASIALSIVFVAAEILHARQGRPSLAQRFPWLIAFSFGLLHGFGFASALAEVGLPQKAIPIALLFFNVGVEIGQLLFVAVVLAAKRLVTWLVDRAPTRQQEIFWRIPPYVIGGLASYWVVQRLAAF